MSDFPPPEPWMHWTELRGPRVEDLDEETLRLIVELYLHGKLLLIDEGCTMFPRQLLFGREQFLGFVPGVRRYLPNIALIATEFVLRPVHRRFRRKVDVEVEPGEHTWLVPEEQVVAFWDLVREHLERRA